MTCVNKIHYFMISVCQESRCTYLSAQLADLSKAAVKVSAGQQACEGLITAGSPSRITRGVLGRIQFLTGSLLKVSVSC